MTLEKLISKCLELYFETALPIHIFLISLLFYLFFDFLLFVTQGFLRDILSLIIIVPFLVLFTYFAGFVIRLHLIHRVRTIISMMFVCIISFVLVGKDVDSILLSVLQDLLYIPLIFSFFYVWLGSLLSQPDESFPTFKKWGRSLNPFKQSRNRKKKRRA